MTIRVAINGYGRIGRNILRAVYENKRNQEVQIVAINDLADAETNAHLTRHDTTHGRFPGTVEVKEGHLVINGDSIENFGEKDPAKLPWGSLGVDVVLECTGHFTSADKAKAHLDGGAKKVLISAPGKGVDKTVVYGVNHQSLTANDRIVSNASCTTNCLTPVAYVLQRQLGIVSGIMTTIHAFTNDQVLLDVYHKDIRRARSATQSMIPTKTGAAAAVGEVLPELKGKFDGFSVRVPTINVSLVDLSAVVEQSTSAEAINAMMKEAAEGELKGILAYTEEPLVSMDYNHTSVSSTFDATLTKVIGGTLIKVLAWYDNEWGFSNRMIDTALSMAKAD
jgi:glyceraldehyde 3-phosphate dehydrogenase